MTADVRYRVRFFLTASGNEPVREWLRSMPENDRRTIGVDLKTVQYDWPLGMPLIRKLETDLWEVRSISSQRVGDSEACEVDNAH